MPTREGVYVPPNCPKCGAVLKVTIAGFSWGYRCENWCSFDYDDIDFETSALKTITDADCYWCAKGDKPEMLDEDGTKCSITGKPGKMSHALDDMYWECQITGVIYIAVRKVFLEKIK